jgi:formylmethanofuran dehydrogenase subunit E
MGKLEFMNQDGEWETFPTDEEMAILKKLMKETSSNPPIRPEIKTVCHLCNEPFPMEEIVVTGGNPIAGYTWSCPKCHAITSTGKA